MRPTWHMRHETHMNNYENPRVLIFRQINAVLRKSAATLAYFLNFENFRLNSYLGTRKKSRAPAEIY